MSRLTHAAQIAAPPDAVRAAILEVETTPAPERSTTKVVEVEHDADGRPSRVTFEIDGQSGRPVIELGYPTPHVITSRLTAATLVARQDQTYSLTEVAGGTRLAYEAEVEFSVKLPGFLFKPLVAKEVRAHCERIRQLAETSLSAEGNDR